MTIDIDRINENMGLTEEAEKPQASALDLLLAKDLSAFKMPSAKVEITRLSEILGTPFVLELKLLNSAVTERIENEAYKFNMDEDGNPEIDIKADLAIINTIIEASYVEGKQIFKSADLRRKFSVRTNEDLVKKMLTPGERKKVHDKYKVMAGFVKTSVEEIKN